MSVALVFTETHENADTHFSPQALPFNGPFPHSLFYVDPRRFRFSVWQSACPTIRRRRSIDPSADAMAILLSMHEARSTLHRKMPPFQSQIIFLWLADLSAETIGQPVACPGQPEMTSSAAQEKPQQAFSRFTPRFRKTA